MTKTAIEWTRGDDGSAGKTWNPVTGCDRVSEGCGMPRAGETEAGNCYAMTLAASLKRRGQPKYQRDGDPRTSGPGFGVTMHPGALLEPLRWPTPSRVFTCSMADVLHDEVTEAFIAQVFAVMAVTPRHTYQVLTKRQGRLRALLGGDRFPAAVHDAVRALAAGACQPSSRASESRRAQRAAQETLARHGDRLPWPLGNVWLGVSVELQRWAAPRINALLAVPAVVRFLSCEPLLGELDLHAWLPGLHRPGPAVDWVIVGGESGPGARPMHPAWARRIRDDCLAAGVPFFYKQHGAWRPLRPVYDQDVIEGGDDPLDAYLGSDAEITSLNVLGVQEQGWRGGSQWCDNQPTPGLDPWWMVRVGKKDAGRDLDGRTWDQFPRARATAPPSPAMSAPASGRRPAP